MIMASIIIPVYNAEKYIKECLDSLLGQTCSDFEIICVDDGSQDHSYEILKEYEERDGRITVITQKNQYAGVARNTGMEQAKGKYLLFLDADDFFCNDMLEQLIKKAEEDRTEVLVFDMFRFDHLSKKVVQPTKKYIKKELFGEGVKSAAEIKKYIFDFVTPTGMNKLFLKEFILKSKICFQATQRANDLFFTYAALSRSERIGILDKKLLYYRVNNAQSIQGCGHAASSDFGQALTALKADMIARKVWEMYKTSFEHMALSVCVYNLGNMKSREAYLKLCTELRDKILPDLELGIGSGNALIEKAVHLREDLIVYGAGDIAKVLVRFLLNQCRYDEKKVFIVVSDICSNEKEICGIRVKEFKDLGEVQKENLVIITALEEKTQDEIEAGVHDRGFKKSVKIAPCEMMAWIRNDTLDCPGSN